MAGLPYHDTMAPPKGLQLVGSYAFSHHAMGVLVGGAHGGRDHGLSSGSVGAGP